MMKLHLKKGAVVRFLLNCPDAPVLVGKVVEINGDEVIIDETIAPDSIKAPRYVSGDLVRRMSKIIKPDTKMHIDRRFIVGWSYENAEYNIIEGEGDYLE